MPDAPQVTCLREGGVLIFQLSGALDHRSALEVIEQIREVFPQGCGRVVFDLAGVTFIRSSGIGALVQVSFDHEVRVVNAVGDVRKTLELAEADRILQFTDGLEAALDSLG